MRKKIVASGAAVIVVLPAVTAMAQFGGPRGPFHERPNIPYDGRSNEAYKLGVNYLIYGMTH